MSFKEKLSKYAQLIVKAGLNVQPAQIVVIDAPVESVELVRLVTKEAYAAGAREVVVKYNDEVVSLYKYKFTLARLHKTYSKLFVSCALNSFFESLKI